MSAPPRVATYDPTTPAGFVRLRISDVDLDNPCFDDTEITAFLTMGNQDWRLAAAYALDTIASNETLAAKIIQTLDLKTDGAALGKELRAQAMTLRDEVEADGSEWAIAEFADPPFQYRERWYKQALREDF